jgi:hypothetical protein
MGAAEINAFLTDLAVNGHVSASTQDQAFSAVLFLYKTVLEVDPGRIAGVVRAVRPSGRGRSYSLRRPCWSTRGRGSGVGTTRTRLRCRGR